MSTSLVRCINSVKIMILLRFLYLFQCIPVFIPKSFLTHQTQSFHCIYEKINNLNFARRTSRDLGLVELWHFPTSVLTTGRLTFEALLSGCTSTFNLIPQHGPPWKLTLSNTYPSLHYWGWCTLCSTGRLGAQLCAAL